jgi:hypothetical protein
MKKRGQNKSFSLCTFFAKNRRGIITEYLPWLLIALIALGILMIYIFILKGEGISLIDKIKNIFSFR